MRDLVTFFSPQEVPWPQVPLRVASIFLLPCQRSNQNKWFQDSNGFTSPKTSEEKLFETDLFKLTLLIYQKVRENFVTCFDALQFRPKIQHPKQNSFLDLHMFQRLITCPLRHLTASVCCAEKRMIWSLMPWYMSTCKKQAQAVPIVLVRDQWLADLGGKGELKGLRPPHLLGCSAENSKLFGVQLSCECLRVLDLNFVTSEMKCSF